ncbi:MAG: HU family DNA-binding protein [Lentimicrobiaceae bacterium]|jgi:DNA-binding protein HU-beta|nr:HU family DNA-binding protein [Lentimicrobiaceae bacterium]MDD4598968.1 HU family DNA-binding protein [Lentimicrobiaceae bacterium]HAH59435.1 DNA-binding protein HU [Bacteroidales bacterium]
MNKSELIDAVAQGAGLTKTQAKSAIDSYHDAVAGELKKGNSVDIAGFGSFSVAERAARTGRNPQTGAPLQIKASKVPKFKPGKGLRDVL